MPPPVSPDCPQVGPAYLEVESSKTGQSASLTLPINLGGWIKLGRGVVRGREADIQCSLG